MAYFTNTATTISFVGVIIALPMLALQAAAIHKQRRELAKLTQTQLADIGVSFKAAKTEANRPFWDIS